MKEKEKWVDISEYEGIYQVSDYGQIRRITGWQCKEARVLKPIDNGKGYLSICLSKNSKVIRFYIHRIVAATFLENSTKKSEVNHKDGNKRNNNLSNLEWLTRSENQLHRYRVLKMPGNNKGKFGALNWKSKQIDMIDKNNNIIRTFPGVMEAARTLGCTDSSIRCCIYGRSKSCLGHKFKYSAG